MSTSTTPSGLILSGNGTDLQLANLEDLNRIERSETAISFLKKNRSPNLRVETESDWNVIVYIYNFWAKNQPKEYADFIHSVKILKKAHGKDNKFGLMKDNPTNRVSKQEIRHSLELPARFYNLFTKLYPLQPLDKKFIRKLLKKLPELRVTDATNV